jgi:hypothetical protein
MLTVGGPVVTAFLPARTAPLRDGALEAAALFLGIPSRMEDAGIPTDAKNRVRGEGGRRGDGERGGRRGDGERGGRDANRASDTAVRPPMSEEC